MQPQRRRRESLTPQQLREWYAGWGCRGGDSTPTTTPAASTRVVAARCSSRDPLACLSRLASFVSGTLRVEGLSVLADRAGHLCVPPDPGIGPAALATGEAAALGASESPAPGTGAAAALGASESASSGAGEAALSGTALASASLTFTLDSGASRSFFRDRTTLTPLGRPVAVSLADPSGGPVLAHFSTVLPCPAAPSGTLSGLYLPSFSTNLVSGADLQDAGFTSSLLRVSG
ncbi:unnamed protein product [Closterium sp. NIES-64]|nr:unnamed protein product [Closterium sp. NIES-64]